MEADGGSLKEFATTLAGHLTAGRSVRTPLGLFFVAWTAPVMARNPTTGQPLTIPGRTLAGLLPAQKLIDDVCGADGFSDEEYRAVFKSLSVDETLALLDTERVPMSVLEALPGRIAELPAASVDLDALDYAVAVSELRTMKKITLKPVGAIAVKRITTESGPRSLILLEVGRTMRETLACA